MYFDSNLWSLWPNWSLYSTCTQGEFLTLQSEDVFRNRLPFKFTNSHLYKPKKITVINIIIRLRKDHPQRIMNQIQQLSWFIDELLCKATITSFFFSVIQLNLYKRPPLYISLQWPLFWRTSIYKLLLKPLYNSHLFTITHFLADIHI